MNSTRLGSDCQNDDNGSRFGAAGGHSHSNTNTNTNTRFNQNDDDDIAYNQENNYINNNNTKDSSLSSIVLVRNSKNTEGNKLKMFQSPTMTISKSDMSYNKKRLATSSGKKGSDLRRMKKDLNFDIHDDHNDHDDGDHYIVPEEDEHEDDGPGFDFMSDNDNDHDHDHDQFTPTTVDGIMNSTTHYNPMGQYSPVDNNNRMSFLDNALDSPSPIQHRKSLEISPICGGGGGGGGSSSISSDSDLEERISRQYSKERSFRNPSYREMSPDCNVRKRRQENPDSISNSISNDNVHDSIESVDSNDVRIYERKRNVVEDEIQSEDNDEDHFNVTLRDDSNFYLNPLKVYRPPRKAASYHAKKTQPKTKKGKKKDMDKGTVNVHQLRKNITQEATLIPTSTFMDEPFKQFGTRAADRLHVVLDWLIERDLSVDPSQTDRDQTLEPTTFGRAVVISVPLVQIISLAICTVVKNGIHQTPRSFRSLESSTNRSCNTRGDRPTYGGTLLVLKSKENVAQWLCALREKTSFSVLNHCEISLTERRRVTILGKCAGYDIVLTTFDALKTKEVTMTVDTNGRIIRQNNSQGAWLSSKSNNSQEESQNKVRVASRLHCIEWTRVIFIDDLGRVSHLTKPGTARMEAATALTAKSR